MLAYKFYWERTKCGEARLLRAFGQSAKAVLPTEIEGVALTEIGAYCFAEPSCLPEYYEVAEVSEEPQALAGESGVALQAEAGNVSRLHELSGNYIEAIDLPDTVQKVGNLAFYRCASLRELAVGRSLIQVGSDVFMNCQSLYRITLRCGRGEQSGLRQILAQITHDLEVTFLEEGAVWAKLLFPEYCESYDEIAPAHVFGRNLEGEGFRARQCLREGIVDFAQYDKIFQKARAEESERTLCSLALNRLRYPVELGVAEKELYMEYLRGHAMAVCKDAALRRKVRPVQFLCEMGLACRSDLEEAIRVCAKAEWAEGTASFLRFVEKYFPRTQGERYGFADF